MRNARDKGITYSGVLHLLVVIVVLAGLPSLLELKREPEPAAITVEIVPIAAISNIKPEESTPAPKEEPKKEPEAKKPAPPVKTAEAPPPPPPPTPVEKKEKAPEKKVEEKKPEEKKPEKKMKEQDLLAVLKSVKETAAKEERKDSKSAEDTSPSKSKSQHYDPGLPMSLSEKDAIKNQISKCWTVPAGAKDAQNLLIVLRVQYEKDGSFINVTLADQSKSRYAKETFFRAAADSAMRAVRMCTPLKGLPPEKYDTWRDIELYFDPKEMLL